MHFFKRGQDTSGAFWVIISVVLGLSFLVIFIILMTQTQGSILNVEFVEQYGCWLSNGIKGGGGAMTWFPTLCSFNIIEDPLTKTEFSKYIRNTWWMYHKGQNDYGAAYGEVYPVYAFSLQEDMPLEDYFQYILAHNNGKTITDMIYSDYNYLEEDSPGLTLCFDSTSATIGNMILEAEKPYYILYYDDQELFGKSYHDQILITEDPSFDRNYFENMLGQTAVYVAAMSINPGLAVSVTVGSKGYEEATGELPFGLFPATEGCIVYGPNLAMGDST